MPQEIQNQSHNPLSASERDVSRQPLHDAPRLVYTLTVEDAARMFADAGVPRSPRSIQRYCDEEHLTCTKVDTLRNEKYLVSEESVRLRIEELKQAMQTSHVSTIRDESRNNATGLDESRHNTIDDNKVKELQERSIELEESNKKLEKDNFELRILNSAKDQMVERIDKQYQELQNKVISYSHKVGQLEANEEWYKSQLKQLAAPQAPREQVDIPNVQRARVIDVNEFTDLDSDSLRNPDEEAEHSQQ